MVGRGPGGFGAATGPGTARPAPAVVVVGKAPYVGPQSGLYGPWGLVLAVSVVAVGVGQITADVRLELGEDDVPVVPGAGLVVVWADPGVTTGWCVVRVPVRDLLERGQVGAVSRMWCRLGQYRSRGTSEAVDSYLSLVRSAYEKAGDEDIVVIGCEGFSLAMQSRDPDLLEPVRFLAVLQDRMRGTPYGEAVGVQVQMPSERIVISDERLKLWGLWTPGLNHGRDAQKHALAFLRRFASQGDLRKRVGWEE